MLDSTGQGQDEGYQFARLNPDGGERKMKVTIEYTTQRRPEGRDEPLGRSLALLFEEPAVDFLIPDDLA